MQRNNKGADLLALGFGTTVAMWACGYVCRLPFVAGPNWLLMILFLVCLLLGGVVAGRYAGRSWSGGLGVGLISACLNLLVLGSLVSGHEPNQIVPSALIWLPGWMVASALLAAIGAAVGGLAPYRRFGSINWTHRFAQVAVVATFLLLAAGGLVTSARAGLAVVDWPNSFGYNMFLYPLSRMTGDIYYEHAHRLLGSLVGLTTLVLAVHLQRSEERAWLRRLGWVALLFVIGQGILGGLRVTGKLTLSTSPEETQPSIILAVIHGVAGQLFFGLMVSLAVFTSNRWRQTEMPAVADSAATQRVLGVLFVLIVIAQLVFGAILRHVAYGLLIHISLAIVVVLLGMLVAIRAWGMYERIDPLPQSGRNIMVLLVLQIALGLGALFVVGITREPGPVTVWDLALTTPHQMTGALILACAVSLMLWQFRLLKMPASS